MKGAYMRCFACLLLVVGILDGPLSFAGDCRNYLLFTLSRGGSQAYVLGSNHYGEPVAPTLSGEVITALKLSSSVYFEVARSENGSAASSVLSSFAQSMRLPVDQRLSSLLDEELRSELSAAFARIPQGDTLLAGLERSRPLFLALVLMRFADSNTTDLAPTHAVVSGVGKFSIDKVIFDIAKQKRKQFGVLEDAQSLARVFDLSLEREIEVLRATLAVVRSKSSQQELASMKKSLDRLLRDGEIDLAVESQAAAYQKFGLSELFRVIVEQRNELFAKRIEEVSRPPRIPFFAMGALHLGGKAGVLNLLRDQGFTVTAVPQRPSC